MIPIDEKIQFVWEKCGFRYGKFDCVSSLSSELNGVVTGWLYPDGTFHTESPVLDGIEALGNLFKYAVPKLWELGYRMELALTAYTDTSDYKIGGGFGVKLVYACSIYVSDYKRMIAQEIDDKDPASALFWAIYKAFGGEE